MARTKNATVYVTDVLSAQGIGDLSKSRLNNLKNGGEMIVSKNEYDGMDDKSNYIADGKVRFSAIGECKAVTAITFTVETKYNGNIFTWGLFRLTAEDGTSMDRTATASSGSDNHSTYFFNTYRSFSLTPSPAAYQNATDIRLTVCLKSNGNPSSNSNVYMKNLRAAVTYEPILYAVRAHAEHGSVQLSNTTTNETDAQSLDCAKGDSVRLTATPDDGYAFSRWSDGETANPRNITVTGEAIYTAAFEKLPAAEDIAYVGARRVARAYLGAQEIDVKTLAKLLSE